MSRLLAILVGIVVLLVAVIIAVPMFIPTSVYKQQVVSLVKTQTGRDLTITGDVGLSFFPRLAVKVENVDLSNAPWAKDKSMASMKELRAAIKILPLFTGNVEIDSFILVDPIIHLEVKADGTPNWQFSEGKAPAATPAEASSGPATVKDIRLGEISVTNGTGTYRNAQSGAALAFEDVNLDVSLPGLDDPFGAEGSVTWNSEPVTFSLAAAKPRALTDGGPTPVEFSLSSSKINVTYKGSFQAFDTVKFTGGLDLDVPSVRDLAAWVGSPMPRGNGFGPLKVHGEVFGSGNSYSFNNAKVSIDGMNATGKVSVVTGGARPVVKGNLAIDKIDANIYLSADGSATPAPATATTPAPAPAGQTGWSNEPINFSGLKAVDANVSLSTEQLLVREIKVGPSALALSLVNGLLNVNLNKLALYDGAGSGTLTLNGASSVPQLQAAFKIAGVKAEPLLTDAAGFERLSGLTAMNFSVNATGRSQREMVNTLGGQGDVKFTNGSVKGINLGALLRNVLTAPATGWTSGGSQDTDFSEMGGTFTIAQGILTNKDLKLLSPLIRVAGSGTVNIPQQTLNYTIQPKLAATLQGQGGSDAKGIEVPVIVEGPWSKPTFRPDLAAMLRDKDKTIDTIKSIKEDGGKGLLDSLMGKPATPPADGSTPPPAEKQKPEDLLKGLFGQ